MTFRDLYFAKDGRPITLDEFARLHADWAYRRIGSHVVGRWWASTVWVGVDYRVGPGPPLIFETMVFRDVPEGDDEHLMDQYQARYSTEQGAREGHAHVVQMLAAIEDAEPVERPD